MTTRISLDVPTQWFQVIKQAALDNGFKSTQEYLRDKLDSDQELQETAQRIGVELPEIKRSWGGHRIALEEPLEMPQNASILESVD